MSNALKPTSFFLSNMYLLIQDIVGSSTACLVILRNDELRIANIGDCGVSIIRHNNYVFRTEEQQHSFNFPVQLGTGSPDTPNDAQVLFLAISIRDLTWR